MTRLEKKRSVSSFVSYSAITDKRQFNIYTIAYVKKLPNIAIKTD